MNSIPPEKRNFSMALRLYSIVKIVKLEYFNMHPLFHVKGYGKGYGNVTKGYGKRVTVNGLR